MSSSATSASSQVVIATVSSISMTQPFLLSEARGCTGRAAPRGAVFGRNRALNANIARMLGRKMTLTQRQFRIGRPPRPCRNETAETAAPELSSPSGGEAALLVFLAAAARARVVAAHVAERIDVGRVGDALSGTPSSSGRSNDVVVRLAIVVLGPGFERPDRVVERDGRPGHGTRRDRPGRRAPDRRSDQSRRDRNPSGRATRPWSERRPPS